MPIYEYKCKNGKKGDVVCLNKTMNYPPQADGVSIKRFFRLQRRKRRGLNPRFEIKKEDTTDPSHDLTSVLMPIII